MPLRISGSDLAFLAAKSALKSTFWVAEITGKAALQGVKAIANHFFPKCEGCTGRIYWKSFSLNERTFHRVCVPECSICKSEMNDLNLLTTTRCHHTFHTSCLNTWAKIKATCPLDRIRLNPNSDAPPEQPAEPLVVELPEESAASLNWRAHQMLNDALARLNEQRQSFAVSNNYASFPNPQVSLEAVRFFLNQQSVIREIESEFKSHGPQRHRRVVGWTRPHHREWIMATILDNMGYKAPYQMRLIFDTLSQEVKNQLPNFETDYLSGNRAFNVEILPWRE